MSQYDQYYLRELQEITSKSLKDLDKMTPKELDELWDIVRKVPTTQLKNRAYISGVRKIGYYKHNTLNKKIYLLYDMHNNRGVCTSATDTTVSVSKWIMNIIRKNESEPNPKYIDVFLEVGSPNSKYKNENMVIPGMHDLTNMMILLSICIHRNDKCPYKYLRSHWVDIRSQFKTFDNFLHYRNEIVNCIRTCSTTKCTPNMIKTTCKYDDKFIIDNPISYLNKIFKLPRIKKQLNNIKNDKIVKELKEYMNDIFLDAKCEYEQRIKKASGNYYDIMVAKFFLLATITISIMDIYLLSRLFRTFNISRGSNHPKVIENVIIYAGGIHSTTYEKFFQRLGFDEVFSVGNFTSIYDDVEDYIQGISPYKYQNQCLDITNLPTPLFK